MLKRTIALILAAALAVGGVSALTACTSNAPDEETTTVGGNGGQLPGEPAPNEGPEEAKRFDYFAADLTQYVTIDRAAYENDTFVLPADLEVTDGDVEEYVRYARFTCRVSVNGTDAKTTDKPLAWGDDAYVYYRILVDGKEIAAASHMDDDEPTRFGLGSRGLPSLEEALIGLVPSDTSREKPAVLNITFPSTYGVSALAGKDAVAEVYVAYSVRYTLPEITEEFLVDDLQYVPQKTFYASDEAIIKEFYEYVEDYLESSVENAVSVAKQNAVWDKLIAAAKFSSLPEEEVNFYYSQRLERIKESHAMQTTRYPTLDEFAPVSMGLAIGADWQAELRRQVERQVKIEMLCFAIAKMEGLDKISDEDLQREIDLWVEYYATQSNVPVTEAEVRENVGLPALYRQAISYKVQTFLLDRMYFMYGEE